MIFNLFRRVSATIAANREYRAPPNMRLYAVGDIHGRIDLLETLIARIRTDIEARPIGTAVVAFLGDLIDRGPDSASVIERLQKLDDLPARTIFLLGNHEEVMLRVLDAEPGLAYDWLGFGGDACVESYGVDAASLLAMDEQRIAAVLKRAIPPEHIAFLGTFGDTFSFGDYLLVHAGIRPGVPLDRQREHDLRWIRGPFLNDANDHGVMVIHGHTISDGVDIRGNRIGIDTGAYRTGVLTAAVIEGLEVGYLDTKVPAAGCE